MALRKSREDCLKKIRDKTQLLVKACGATQPKQRTITTKLSDVRTALVSLEKGHYDYLGSVEDEAQQQLLTVEYFAAI